MVFSGITFLYYFLPCVLLLYFLAPAKAKNTVLLMASLFFYAWGESVYILLMLFSIFIGYIAGLLLEKTIQRPIGCITPKVVLTGAVGIFTLLFIIFKYTDFIIENVNAATGMAIPLRHIVLPIGISFYTFQMISYIVDVYRGQAKVQKNILKLAMYISLFPQLIAGPIVRYTTIEEQIPTTKDFIIKYNLLFLSTNK